MVCSELAYCFQRILPTFGTKLSQVYSGLCINVYYSRGTKIYPWANAIGVLDLLECYWHQGPGFPFSRLLDARYDALLLDPAP